MNISKYSVDELVFLLEKSSFAMPDGWQSWQETILAHKIMAQKFLSTLSKYPKSRYSGRGIVICAGGGYFPPAWVCMRMLRHFGCTLPIQFWHFSHEIDKEMKNIVQDFDVECIDAEEVRKAIPIRCLSGWVLKPYALLNCPFEEVLFLDADNVPIMDPTYLFGDSHYLTTGAIFWPDRSSISPEAMIWKICEVDYRNEPEFESGQMVINKQKCWEALRLTMHYNEHSDFYYKYLYGDKDTFHIAFRRLGIPYSMPPHPLTMLKYTFCQYDFDGRLLFQHRGGDKWRFSGGNLRIEGFKYEDLCFNFLRELKSLWSGRIFRNDNPDDEEKALMAEISGKYFKYNRIGHEVRILELKENGTIGQGQAAGELFWSINKLNGVICLTILNENSPTCFLCLEDDGVWRGHWVCQENMRIELTEITN